MNWLCTLISNHFLVFLYETANAQSRPLYDSKIKLFNSYNVHVTRVIVILSDIILFFFNFHLKQQVKIISY